MTYSVPASLSVVAVAALLAAAPAVGQTKSLAAEAKLNPPLVFESRTRNNLLFDGKLAEANDARDVFRLPLRANEAVTLLVRSKSMDSKLEVRAEDPAGGSTLLVEDDDSGGGRDARLRFAAPGGKGGTFYVLVRSRSGAGIYTMEARKRDLAPPPRPLDLAFGTNVRGKVDETSPWHNETGLSYQLFNFTGAAGDRVQASVTPLDNESPISIRIIGPHGPLPTQKTAAAPVIVQSLGSAGSYQVEVGFMVGRDGKDSEFNLGLEKLPPANFVATPEALSPGVVVNGRFGPDSPVLSPSASQPYALYTIRGTAGQKFVANFKMEDKKGVGASPIFPMLDVGVDSPAGFAAVASSLPRSPTPTVFEFQRDGEMQIRIVAATGTEAGYTLQLEHVTGAVNLGPE